MKNKIFKSANIKYGQIITICFSVLFITVWLYGVVSSKGHSPKNFLSAVFVALMITLVNFLLAQQYFVQVEDEVIIVENIWRKFSMPLNELTNIELDPSKEGRMIFFFINGEKYYCIINKRLKVKFSKGGYELYIDNLKKSLIKRL